MAIIKIALTGGISCGKSQVSQIFRKLGVDTIDLDIIARAVVEPNKQGLLELVNYFGSKILNKDKSLNRQTLRDLMLETQDNKQVIEDILHPKILKEMQIKIAKIKNKLVIIEVPLLIEKNLFHLFDRVIIVDCDEEKQLSRLLKRQNFDKNSAKKIIKAQIKRKQRLSFVKKIPTDIIKNNAQILDLEKKVKDLYQKLINL